MNKTLIASLLVFAFSGSAYASPELATKNKCNTCHAMDKKMLGPSWKEIAAKNRAMRTPCVKWKKPPSKGARASMADGDAAAAGTPRPMPMPWPSGS